MTEHLPECSLATACKHEYYNEPPIQCANCGESCICPDEERSGGLITRQRAEQIGRNIGKYGCVITEQQHLPECPMLEPFSADETQHCFCSRPDTCIHYEMECICDRLRACEERMREKHRHRCSGCDWCYSDGAREALDAAREAVSALPEYRMRDACIAAIEQLREEKK